MMNSQIWKRLGKTVAIATLTGFVPLSVTMVMAQNRPPAPPERPAPGELRPARPLPPGRYDNGERAYREIGKAREEAFRVEQLAQQVSSSEAVETTAIAQTLLSQAESAYSAGQYFVAEETARAAKNTYEAAETLYEAELGYVVDHRGPRQPSGSYFNAPYEAPERIARAEAELSYYQASDPIVSELLNQARELVGTSSSYQEVQVSNADFAYLAENRAAKHLAEAAIHLMRAERGF
jgi:hypothetical protein